MRRFAGAALAPVVSSEASASIRRESKSFWGETWQRKLRSSTCSATTRSICTSLMETGTSATRQNPEKGNPRSWSRTQSIATISFCTSLTKKGTFLARHELEDARKRRSVPSENLGSCQPVRSGPCPSGHKEDSHNRYRASLDAGIRLVL